MSRLKSATTGIPEEGYLPRSEVCQFPSITNVLVLPGRLTMQWLDMRINHAVDYTS